MKFGRHVQHSQEIYCIVGPLWTIASGAVGHVNVQNTPINMIAKHESSSQDIKITQTLNPKRTIEDPKTIEMIFCYLKQ
ncbi:hypothetical protein WDU94_011049 [Cyamophila willieti]